VFTYNTKQQNYTLTV